MDGETTVRTGEAYVSGALTALEEGARMRLFYELLAEVVESVGLRAYLPHRVTDPVAAAHLDPRAVYDIDRAHVTSAPSAPDKWMKPYQWRQSRCNHDRWRSPCWKRCNSLEAPGNWR